MSNIELKRQNKMLKKALEDKELGMMDAQLTINNEKKTFEKNFKKTLDLQKEISLMKKESDNEKFFLLTRSQELENKIENMQIAFGKDHILGKKIEKMGTIFTGQITQVFIAYSNVISFMKRVHDTLYMVNLDLTKKGTKDFEIFKPAAELLLKFDKYRLKHSQL